MRRGQPEYPEHHLPQGAPPDELAEAGETLSSEPSGSMRAKLANAMVGLKKEYYGRGPTAAKAWLLDEYILVAMEGGLTRNEETLLAAGQEDLVRTYRLAFQEAMTATAVSTVEEITGRRVAAYHSQIVFEPTRAFEIFVLEPERR
jgi:uncharacterized protein YbcI